jgi:hypothetical protein
MIRKFDAVIVLGISTARPVFRRRVNKAAELYHAGKAKKVIFSGRWWGGLSHRPKTTEAKAMASYARIRGIPSQDILLEESSLNTIGNLFFCKTLICKPRRMRKLAIITQPSHMRKTRYLAGKIFGGTYRLELVSEGGENVLHHRSSSVEELKHYFGSIQEGDDRAIAQLLKNHPYYASKPQIAGKARIRRTTGSPTPNTSGPKAHRA